MRRITSALAAICLTAQAVSAEIVIPFTYLHQKVEHPPTLSNLDPIPADQGQAGAELGLQDNLTTGRFLGHKYSLNIVSVEEGGDFIAQVRAALASSPFLLLDAPTKAVLQAADLPEAQQAILFDVSNADMALRDSECRANLLLTLPSRQMRSDAVMQFALSKRWRKLSMITGAHPGDQAFAQALRNSANKFGLDISNEKTWAFDADMRRNAAQELPVFTQDLGDYDLLLVADELDDFSRYISYNTWLPRPVAGSDGLVPTAWAPVVEQWGAAQLQSRFKELAQRPMRPRDYAAWAAIRSIGEAVTRTNSASPSELRSYMLSDDFQLAGFKGRPLSYRKWNGQLRQPIVLVTDRALVGQAPLPGFLHQHNEMDSLGLDRPESKCEVFEQ